MRKSTSYVDPIVAQAAKTSTEGWLFAGAEADSEVVMDEVIDQNSSL